MFAWIVTEPLTKPLMQSVPKALMTDKQGELEEGIGRSRGGRTIA